MLQKYFEIFFCLMLCTASSWKHPQFFSICLKCLKYWISLMENWIKQIIWICKYFIQLWTCLLTLSMPYVYIRHDRFSSVTLWLLYTSWSDSRKSGGKIKTSSYGDQVAFSGKAYTIELKLLLTCIATRIHLLSE